MSVAQEPRLADASSGEQPASAAPADWAAWARQAAAEKKWTTALERWDRSIEKFGVRPEWLGQKANALRHLDRIDESEEMFEALAREHPELPIGLNGLAWSAFRKNEFERALSLFTRCIETFPGKKAHAWTRMRASLLLRLGRPDEAEALCLRLMREDPENRGYKSAFVRAAIENCRERADHLERRDELSKFVVEQIVKGGDEADRLSALQLLTSLGALDAAAKLLVRTLHGATTLADMEHCFQFIPRHVERGSRGALWNQLHSRVRSILSGPERGEHGRAFELELRLLLALERFPEFVAQFDARRAVLRDSKWYVSLERIRERFSRPRSEIFAEPKVFGIGLSRTGTTSLAAALTTLGIDTAHWTNPLTHQLISEIDIFMFGACTDCCVAQDFEKLYYLYPNARFVWTQRPIDPWKRSYANHQWYFHWARDVQELRDALDKPQSIHLFSRAATEFGLYLNSPDLVQAHRVFGERVRLFFSNKPEDKLLDLDLSAGQGWPELCGFLDRPVPAVPFPKLNAARE